MIDKLTRITVLPNKTFRGVLHFEETNYDCSDVLADYAIKEGVAKLSGTQPKPRKSKRAK